MNQTAKKFVAASVPRSIRQQRLSHLPLSCIVGSHFIQGADGSNLVFDVIMLPPPEFQRIRTGVGIRQVLGPAFNVTNAFQPGFVMQDTKEVVVPADIPNQEAFAKAYFIKAFGLEDV